MKFFDTELWKWLKLIIEIVLIAALICSIIWLTNGAKAEEDEEEPEYAPLYVMTKSLNGRSRPGKKYPTIVEFEMWTPLQTTGRMSRDHQWIEIRSTEGDVVWCNVNYLSERTDLFYIYTLNRQPIKIRKNPGCGKVTGYAKKEQRLEITQVVMGYGKCSKGWVDLSYFIEDCD